MGIFQNTIDDGRRMGTKMYLDSLPPEKREQEKQALKEADPKLYAELFGNNDVGTISFTVKAENNDD